MEGANLTSIPTPFLEQQNSQLGQEEALPSAPFLFIQVPAGDSSLSSLCAVDFIEVTITRHPLGPTLSSLSLPHILLTPTITDAHSHLSPK